MSFTSSSRGEPPWPPLPIPIVRGQPVFDLAQGTAGTVAGITEAYCLYRSNDTEQLGVARWRAIATANVCPARQLLAPDVSVRDHQNASAALLRELISLRLVTPFTAHQKATFDELVRFLCLG